MKIEFTHRDYNIPLDDSYYEDRPVPDEIAGVLGTSLYWQKTDTGAWGLWNSDGPIQELYVYGARWVALNAEDNRRVCIQAGANQGMYPKFYSNFFEKVYTFEPDPDNYKCVEKNCGSVDNIVIQRAALGTGGPPLHLIKADNRNTGMHRTFNSEMNGSFEVPQISIDSLELDNVDLIHLDIEQFEETALRGAIDTIERCKPVIISEAPGLSQLLVPLGYECKGRLHDTVFLPIDRG